MQRCPGGGMKKYYNAVEEEYLSNDGFSYKTDQASFMMKGGDGYISPPKHSSFLHKQSYEGYGHGHGHANHGHEGFKAHHSENWLEKDKHHDGGWGGNHGGYSNSGGWGGKQGGHSEHGGWGTGKQGGYSEHGGKYEGGYGGNYSSGGGGYGGGYGHHYESYKSMGGGPQKGLPLWNFKGIDD